jgi:hypothetical protein
LISASTLSAALWCSVMPSVQQICAGGPGVLVRELPDQVRWDAGVALGALKRVPGDGLAVLVEVGRGAPDELLVREPGGDDLVGDRVR